MEYLLDTDTCLDLLRGVTLTVQNAQEISPDQCAISTVTSFELLAGVERSAQPAKERQKVLTFIAAVHELPFHHRAAAESARIRAELESKSLGIGAYDVQIAGQALADGLTLVTSNTREFGRIAGLPILDWHK